ncbi:hypothetical protein AVEN_24843-1 [Araneus ventricosus]|uniref:Uncharacterized protein n=1 Tax=Araneus ventricosus TaxID=182803 RepID=A0A4Y2BTT3_ARAVE|nr:hypothetical protein AVEN_24843-1 [Araneus ventricosus]
MTVMTPLATPYRLMDLSHEFPLTSRQTRACALLCFCSKRLLDFDACQINTTPQRGRTAGKITLQAPSMALNRRSGFVVLSWMKLRRGSD